MPDPATPTLRSHIEAMGGKLEVLASFPEKTYPLTEPAGLDKIQAWQKQMSGLQAAKKSQALLLKAKLLKS